MTLVYILVALGTLLAFPTQAEGDSAGAQKEALVIILHKSNPVENLSLEELRQLFLGEKKYWVNNRKVTLAVPRAGTAERAAALKLITGMEEAEFNKHWIQMSFTGQAAVTPKELATGAGLRKFVFNVPGAIGCVRARDLDDSVKGIRVDGLTPKDTDYKLILASP